MSTLSTIFGLFPELTNTLSVSYLGPTPYKQEADWLEFERTVPFENKKLFVFEIRE